MKGHSAIHRAEPFEGSEADEVGCADITYIAMEHGHA